MRAAARAIIAAGALAISACQQDVPNQTVLTNNSAGAEIEALPPDESSATPSEELEGAAGTGNEAAGNGY